MYALGSYHLLNIKEINIEQVMITGKEMTLVRLLRDNLSKIEDEKIPAGLIDGQIGKMLLHTMLYIHTGDLQSLASSQKLLNLLLSKFESSLFSSDRSFSRGILGFVWAVGIMDNWGILQDGTELKMRLSRILSFKSPLDDTPLRMDLQDIVYGEGLAESVIWRNEETFFRYRLQESLISRIDDVSHFLKKGISNISLWGSPSLSFIYSIYFFLMNMRTLGIYPYKVEHLLEEYKRINMDLSEFSLADRILYSIQIQGEEVYFRTLSYADIDIDDTLSRLGLYSLIFNNPRIFTTQTDESYYAYCLMYLDKGIFTLEQLIGQGIGIMNRFLSLHK